MNNSTLIKIMIPVIGLMVALITAVVGYFVFQSWWSQPPAVLGFGDGPTQPIAFPHTTHVTEAGIDCQFCHRTVSTDEAAGIPAVAQCQFCHDFGKIDGSERGAEAEAELAKLIGEAMDHKGFSIVHVQSPCTTYNDTFDLLKGNKKLGIAPQVYAVPEDHDPTDKRAAEDMARAPGVPLGVLYKEERPTLEDLQEDVRKRARSRTPQEMVDTYTI